jgi:hypothetical protein
VARLLRLSMSRENPIPGHQVRGGVFRASRAATMTLDPATPMALAGLIFSAATSNFSVRARSVKNMGKNMSYRISYDDEWAISANKSRNEDLGRTETFRTEHEALNRARELLDDGNHQAVSVSDSSGDILGGVLLQLKLGFTAD